MISNITQVVLFVVIIYKVINLIFFLGKNIKQNNIQLADVQKEKISNEMTVIFEKKVMTIILFTGVLAIIQLVNIML